MFVGTVIIALFALLTISSGAVNDNVWTGFRATWPRRNEKRFYALPQSLGAAQSEGWTEIEGVTISTDVDVIALGYKGNARYVILFSRTTRNPLGVQIGFKVADVVSVELRKYYDNHSYMKKKNLNGVDYYTATMFFAINGNGIRQMWYDAKKGPKEIPTTIDGLTERSTFVKRGCYKTMGTHWYQDRLLENCDDIFPWSLLTVGQNVVGFIFQAIGRTSVDPTRIWHEQFTANEIKLTFPDAPQCLLSSIPTLGLISVHNWLVDNPTSITCSG